LPTVIPRIKVLLIPFAIWTAIRYILLHRPPTSIHEILDPYYFIVLLVQFYLLSPIIVPFAKSNWKILLIVVALIQFIAAEGTVYLQLLGLEIPGLSTIIAWTPRWFFPGRLFYFALGIVAGIHYEGFKEWLVEVKWHLLAIVVITGFLSLLEYELADRISGETWLGPNNPGFSRMIYASSVSLCFLAFEGGSIPFSKIISGLGAKSLGIYLGNLPAAYVAASIMYKLTPSALGNQLLYQSVLWLAALGVPLLLMEVVRRTPFRSGYRYLFG
jgi:membrane-bound acyltransferase YfiQ involved in biofilm formation